MSTLPAAGAMRPHHRALLVAEILAAYAPLERALRGNDLETMVRVARVPARAGAGPLTEADELRLAARLAFIVRRVLWRLPTDDRCLITSLVLVRLLARRGVTTRVMIGVKGGSQFGAHAWVEHGSHPLLPRGDYEELMEL